MTARQTFRGPDRLVVAPVLETVELFRVVHVWDARDPRLVDDLTSNYARRARPRGIERFYSVIHMAVSTFTTAEAAAALAHRFPAIGGHVATLRLPGRVGFCIDDPPAGAHRSLWGEPERLAACVVSVQGI